MALLNSFSCKAMARVGGNVISRMLEEEGSTSIGWVGTEERWEM